jgi:hypothetical protein
MDFYMINIRSTLSFGGELKPEVPCREILQRVKNHLQVWKMWDFKFSRRRVWSSESSGMYCRVLNWMSIKNTAVHPRRFWASSMKNNISQVQIHHSLRPFLLLATKWLLVGLPESSGRRIKSFFCRHHYTLVLHVHTVYHLGDEQ